MHRLRHKQSKRLSVHQKHKIEKRVLQHHKKMRRASKGIHKGKPTSSIPNSCPFKLELLQELHARKEEDQRVKAELRDRRKELEKDKEYEKVTEKAMKKAGTSQGVREFMEGLGQVDAVVEVLEARDPEFYRCKDVENWAISQGKKLLLAIHKADLVESDTLEAWLFRYKQEFACIPTSKTSRTVKGSDKRNAKLKDAILEALNLGAVSSTGVIAIVGFPNVGKSSLANILLGTKRMRISTQPGSTATNQTAAIDTHIGVSVIDTIPLTALGTEESKDQPLAQLKRVTNIDNISDPFTPVQGLLMKIPKDTLKSQYKTDDYESIQEFLGAVAKTQALYKRPGMVDYEAAAKVVLFDWTTGKIAYCEGPVS